MSDATEILETLAAWTRAEVAADIAALEAALHPEFLGVGPLGFVLTKEAWLDRHRSGALHQETLRLEDSAARVFGGDAAVVVSAQAQRITYNGAPGAGRFRATHVLVREGGAWLLAGLQLSAMAPPPGRPGQA